MPAADDVSAQRPLLTPSPLGRKNSGRFSGAGIRDGQTPETGSALSRQEGLSATGLVSRVGCYWCRGVRAPLLQGCSNGSLGFLDRDPEGELESRL
jgi:hypothetical protein